MKGLGRAALRTASEQRDGHSVWHDWISAFRLLWSTGPLTILGIILLTVVAASLPAVQVQALAWAVQAVADGITQADRSSAVRAVALPAALLAGVMLAAHVLGIATQYLSHVMQLKLGALVSERLMEVGTRLELEVAREALTLVSVAVVIMGWNPWIALLVILSPIPAAIGTMWFGAISYQIEYDRAPGRRLLSYLQHLTTRDHSFKEVRLFGLGAHLINRYRGLVREFLAVDRSIAARQAWVLGGLGLVTVVGAGAAITAALFLALDNGRLGELAGYLQALTTINASMLALLAAVGGLFELSLFLGNLFAVFRMPRNREGTGGLPFPRTLKQGIEFRNVSFTYPGTTREVLHDVSFRIPARTCVAFVGRNGSGKTSVVKLLTRLYEPTSGQILLEGRPIEEYDLDAYRANIGVIFQDFIRYEMSVRDNIGFGRVDELAHPTSIAGAAAAAGIDAEIRQMEHGYDTTLGRHFVAGRQLSGGQWQRMALARAFVRKAPIVVLDEPTAAIDAESEREIFERFREQTRDASTFLIAHRFSTVRIADRVVVIDGGRIIEQGTHEELLAVNGQYAHLYHLQASAYGDPQPTSLDIEEQGVASPS
ncbi:ABC transporter ATP-binding protein [Propioniciclava sp. MC1683]|uniref:ABC transporter ATP-binding protein n=1 Tax=Propioniciclava sp. MC1683 TaxID=2760309 RepID=UPI001602CD0D|nr:ABC transporter ATP-binding protein [Propioniciclava sp. MC1683]MBB1501894.1 ABC transporter ATP-binding protein [Propioniciclava sp. MC1683]